MQAKYVIRFLVMAFVVVFVALVFVSNIRLLHQHEVDFDQYKTVVHNATKSALEAEQLEPCLAMARNASAQASLNTSAALVGGHRELSLMSGYDTSQLLVLLVKQEEHIRTVAVKRQVLSPHAVDDLQTTTQPHHTILLPTANADSSLFPTVDSIV